MGTAFFVGVETHICVSSLLMLFILPAQKARCQLFNDETRIRVSTAPYFQRRVAQACCCSGVWKVQATKRVAFWPWVMSTVFTSSAPAFLRKW